ncbi:ParA family protein [Oscillospiraceae bacterium CM]|nr:ParA family protein [Oscillospiraceae bacterium CM]
MISTAIFNNKGGVGKTTFLCNLASYLQTKCGKKVLVVDADPQCNSTSYVLDDDDYYDVYFEQNNFTIADLIPPLKNGLGYAKQIKATKSDLFGFDLIAGNPELAAHEDFLSKDWSELRAKEIRGIRTNMLFVHFLTLCQEYDYVFFDMGPSLGAINRAVLLACDYFITPMSSDIFSVLALKNIGESISTWRDLYNETLSDVNPKDKALFEGLKDKCNIKFLGYVEQQYISKSSGGKKVAVRSYEKILSTIPDEIKRYVIAPINGDIEFENYNLGSIPNFYSLIPMSQTAHKPVFLLTNADGVLGAHYQKVSDYNEMMGGITQRVLQNMEALK